MLKKVIWLFTAIILIPSLPSLADDEPDYEEIAVLLNVDRVGSFNINAIYSYKNENLYLPVTKIFQILQIKMEVTPKYDTISGFYIKEDRPYRIDYPTRRIKIGKKITQLDEDDMIKTKKGLFLRTAIFGKAFSLHCDFNFQNLSVELTTDLQLPALQELRREQIRQRRTRITGEVESDTTLNRRYHWFRGGMVDYRVNSRQVMGGETETRALLDMGGELLGGETNAYLDYSTKHGFLSRRQNFSWRWVNNDLSLVRQIHAGNINKGAIANIYAPVWGVAATNTPTTYRRSMGEYTISDYTEPEWMVELYVNNVLIDYTQADASGFYSFEVPLMYGTSNVELRFFGPYGEERFEKKFINIPYNFLPPGEIEYNIKGGRVQDENQSLFSRTEMNVGITKFITLGGGMEYLSSLQKHKKIPFLSTSANLFRHLMIEGEYAHNVKTSALVNYRTSSNMRLELNYINYKKGQQAIRAKPKEERIAKLIMPWRFDNFNMYSRLSFRQNVYELHKYNRAEMMLSGNMGAINTNLSTSANWISEFSPNILTTLALRYRFRNGLRISTRSRINMGRQEVTSLEARLNWRFSNKGHLSCSYREYPSRGTRSFDLAFRYELPYAQSNVSVRSTRGEISSTQGIRGSLALGSGKGYVHASNRSAVKKGGITLVPFLDINQSGQKDENEPLVSSLDVSVNGDRTMTNPKDSLIRIVGLEPYTSYQLSFDESSLKNIAWQLPVETMEVHVDPNQFKKIQVPVQVMGEANGMVLRSHQGELKGFNRMTVQFYTKKGSHVASTTSEFDGYFTYLGLPPGQYYARIDSQQLNDLNLNVEPQQIEFKLNISSMGDIEDGLEFVLTPEEAEKPRKEEEAPSDSVPDSLANYLYYLQLGAFQSLDHLNQFLGQIIDDVPTPIGLFYEEGFYKLRLGFFMAEKKEALRWSNYFQDNGYASWIGRNKTDIHEKPDTLYYLQTGAFDNQHNALQMFRELSGKFSRRVGIYIENNLYKVRLGYFKRKSKATEYQKILREEGFNPFLYVQ